jgi:hypothetical protein
MSDLAIVVIVGIVFIALCFIIINQMLMVNAINKRLMSLTEVVLIEFASLVPAEPELSKDETTESDYPFDPHEYDEVE